MELAALKCLIPATSEICSSHLRGVTAREKSWAACNQRSAFAAPVCKGMWVCGLRTRWRMGGGHEDHKVRVRQLQSREKSGATAPRLQKPHTECNGWFEMIALWDENWFQTLRLFAGWLQSLLISLSPYWRVTFGSDLALSVKQCLDVWCRVKKRHLSSFSYRRGYRKTSFLCTFASQPCA